MKTATILTTLALGLIMTVSVQPAAACAGEGCPWYRYVETAENAAELAVYIICQAENLGETVQACFNYWYDFAQNLPARVLEILLDTYCDVLGDPNRPPCN